jgi:hypothetical protein
MAEIAVGVGEFCYNVRTVKLGAEKIHHCYRSIVTKRVANVILDSE